MKISDPTFIDVQRHYASYAVVVGTETNSKANISEMETYAISNKWVKISDPTFIDLQKLCAPYAVFVGTETNGKDNISDKENLCSQQ